MAVLDLRIYNEFSFLLMWTLGSLKTGCKDIHILFKEKSNFKINVNG